MARARGKRVALPLRFRALSTKPPITLHGVSYTVPEGDSTEGNPAKPRGCVAFPSFHSPYGRGGGPSALRVSLSCVVEYLLLEVTSLHFVGFTSKGTFRALSDSPGNPPFLYVMCPRQTPGTLHFPLRMKFLSNLHSCGQLRGVHLTPTC